MIKRCLQNTPDPVVIDFCKTYRKKLFKGGNKALPNFSIEDNGVLVHIKRIGKREERRKVVTKTEANEIVKALHIHSDGVCNPGGINSLENYFCSTYYYRGIRVIVKSVLSQCKGTCKLTKTLETMPPAPLANRSMQVMEELQCDLITITSKKGVPSSSDHDFKYILTVKDCFSKYCWLNPLESKEALPILRILSKIFHDHGPPKLLHTDNGSEFINTMVKNVCSRFNIRMIHGRPYHPQSQGQVENLNRRVKNCLRHFLLAHEECERSTVWPGLVKDIEYFVNHTWHHTINCTPYSAFHGRIGSLKIGDRCAEPEYMEEDFLFMDTDEDDLSFELHTLSKTGKFMHTNDQQNQQALYMLGAMQVEQAQLKRKIFESTESTILHNKRAHIKKIKHRNYPVGQNVLFRNPNSTGLSTTLNVRGKVVDKLGIDLYKVEYGNKSTVLFGCQMVYDEGSSEQNRPPVSDKPEVKISNEILLDKIYQISDMQRNFIIAKRRFQKCAEIDAIIETIGIDKSDLTSLYYYALDCGLLASTTTNESWRSDLEKYHEALLAYIHSHRFQYYLSGVYLWESFRAQTVSLLLDCVANQVIPLFHYCSDCVNDGLCPHECCNLWLQNACNRKGYRLTNQTLQETITLCY